MATNPLLRRRARRLALVIGAMLALLGVNATPGMASASEERQGAQLLQSVQAGKQKCQQLSRTQSELIGESVMGRMVGSTARHEAMNRQLTATSGASGEVQAHVFMGQRFAGCSSGAAPAAFGSMMGMMGNYSGASNAGMGNNSGTNSGAMGNGRSAADGSGMVGGSVSRTGSDNGWSSTDTVLIILVAVLAAALLAIATRRPWRGTPPRTPVELLSDRYARGDIDTADYEQRRHALGSPA